MVKFIARYWNGETRPLKAKNVVQARYMANGIAKANGWVLKELGRV